MAQVYDPKGYKGKDWRIKSNYDAYVKYKDTYTKNLEIFQLAEKETDKKKLNLYARDFYVYYWDGGHYYNKYYNATREYVDKLKSLYWKIVNKLEVKEITVVELDLTFQYRTIGDIKDAFWDFDKLTIKTLNGYDVQYLNIVSPIAFPKYFDILINIDEIL